MGGWGERRNVVLCLFKSDILSRFNNLIFKRLFLSVCYILGNGCVFMLGKKGRAQKKKR